MRMIEVTIGYGMTETSPISTQTRTDDTLDRRVVHRRPGPPARRDQDRRPGDRGDRPHGMPGEFCTRGYSVMRGYWDDPRRRPRRSTPTAGCTPATWPRWTPQGYVNITGRIKDMLIRGGENIYPREIEEFLYTHPGHRRRAGHRRARRALRRGDHGVDPAAPGRPALTVDDVRTFAAGQLAHYKIPRYVRIVDAFPMT